MWVWADWSRYVWPVGFRSRRLYTSKYQKDKRVWCVAPLSRRPCPTIPTLIERMAHRHSHS